jgi:hypothetical protein
VLFGRRLLINPINPALTVGGSVGGSGSRPMHLERSMAASKNAFQGQHDRARRGKPAREDHRDSRGSPQLPLCLCLVSVAGDRRTMPPAGADGQHNGCFRPT